MTCHLLPFVSYLDQPHLLRDLVAFRCHRRQWHHGPGGSRFFASADDTGLQLLGRLSCQPPVSPASWAHHLPLHSHGKNDDHLSDGDRGKGSQRTQDDNVCVRHQPRQIPIFSSLVSFSLPPPPPLSSLFFCPSTKGGKWALCGANEALLQGQCDPRSPQLDFSLTISWDEIQAMPRWTAALIGSF